MGPAAGAAVGKALVSIFINALVSVAVTTITKAMQKKPVKPLQKVDVAYSGALEPRRKLYGYFRAAGLNTIPAITSLLDGLKLHQVLTLSDGEISAINAVWINNDRIPASAWAGASGAIIGGKYDSKLHIRPHLGLASQSVDSFLIQIPGWTNEHRGDGIAYLYAIYTQNNEVYSAGVPTLLAEGEGALIYNPALDTSPGANPTSPTTKAFSENAALILADFLTWGAGENLDNIDWDDVVAAQAACDQLPTIPNGIGGSTTQRRFTCNKDIYAPQTLAERDETIGILTRAMMGACWNSGGKWRMRAGVWSTPVGSISEDDFLSDVHIATAQPRSTGGAFNTVRGSYVDGGENVQPKPIPEVSASAYVAEDGEVIYSDAAFPTCRTVYEAERNAILLLRQARRRISISAVFKFKTAKFELYDIVYVTCSKVGWVDQTCRIVAMSFRQNFTVEIQLQQVEEADYADPELSDYATPNAIALPDSSGDMPSAPSNLTATSTANGIIFTWDPPAGAPVGVLYKLYEHTSSTPFGSAVQVSTTTPQTSLVLPRADTTVRYYWVVAVDPVSGVSSVQAPPSNGVPGNAQSASSALAAVAYPGSAASAGFGTSQTTTSSTVTPTGGTAPYTYTWTFTSGGTGITTDSASSATTTWSASSLAEGETRSGTARCRVQDNVGATFDVYVAVTIERLFDITLVDTTVNASGSTGGPGNPGAPAIATYTISNAGGIYWSPGSSYTWLDPSADPSDYQVRFTLNSGTLDSASSATGTWLSLGSARQLRGIRQPNQGPGTSTQNVTVEIRLAAFPFTVLETATVILNETIP